jgi:low temperature requirement protein LtrA
MVRRQIAQGTFGSPHDLQRTRQENTHNKVTFVELFFDLVFVFAITQLSHNLLEHFTPAGAAQTLLLLLAVWLIWVHTCWATNWIDPERIPVRLMLFALMLAGLVLSTSLPDAFGERGPAFAIAFVAMQLGRSLFMLWSLRHHNPGNFRNYQRITVWLAVSGAFWIAGGLIPGDARFALWILALIVDIAGPSCGFWTPGLGASTTADWNVEGAHMAERCALFVIIALGESIVVTGATFAKMQWDAPTVGAFLAAFIGSVAMWWIYFNIGAEKASKEFVASSDPGRIARLAYTYIHAVLIAGVVVAAVGDELALAHPGGSSDIKVVGSVLLGPALFLIGNILFKRATLGQPALSHMVGLALLVLLIPAAAALSPLLLSAASTLVLVIVAAWESWSLRDAKSEAESVQDPVHGG